MKDIRYSGEIGLNVQAEEISPLSHAFYFVGLKIARFGSVTSILAFIAGFFGALIALAVNGQYLWAALLWVFGGVLLPISLRVFQAPFGLVGGALVRLSGKSVFTQLEMTHPHFRNRA